jgi:hypothetical protein
LMTRALAMAPMETLRRKSRSDFKPMCASSRDAPECAGVLAQLTMSTAERSRGNQCHHDTVRM